MLWAPVASPNSSPPYLLYLLSTYYVPVTILSTGAVIVAPLVSWSVDGERWGWETKHNPSLQNPLQIVNKLIFYKESSEDIKRVMCHDLRRVIYFRLSTKHDTKELEIGRCERSVATAYENILRQGRAFGVSWTETSGGPQVKWAKRGQDEVKKLGRSQEPQGFLGHAKASRFYCKSNQKPLT